ncbi:MAG: hypothetical protein DCC55_02345 [Chloroflexi bacterium]|nr:MAG: hypothetical protein DCC55_02345 [Chloroflexota bacterium]
MTHGHLAVRVLILRYSFLHRLRIGAWSILLLAALLLGGCLPFVNRQATLTLDLTDFLPPDWQPVGQLQTINIDDDDASEYLLLYTYDHSGGVGPVGALILDPQSEAVVTDENERLAIRPSSFLNPYPILPNYWTGSGQGFIAAPDQRDAVVVTQVAYTGAGFDATPARPDLLILRGGDTYLTFVWWRSVNEGYGVAQLYAPGGFEGVDWAAWQRAPAPILSIVSTVPLHDRNLFCRKVRHDLVEAETFDPAAYQQAIRFTETDLGLHFCHGPPAHPFYPEGVVLAYLLHPDHRLALSTPALREDSARQASISQLIGFDILDRVEEILGYPTVAVRELENASPSLERIMPVCAQVVVRPEGEQGPAEQRWLLFELDHQPPLAEPATPHRLFVRNVLSIPASPGVVGLSCRQILGL